MKMEQDIIKQRFNMRLGAKVANGAKHEMIKQRFYTRLGAKDAKDAKLSGKCVQTMSTTKAIFSEIRCRTIVGETTAF